MEGLAECDLLVQAVDVEESPVASYAQLEELIFVGNVFLWSLISNAPSSAMASKGVIRLIAKAEMIRINKRFIWLINELISKIIRNGYYAQIRSLTPVLKDG